MKDETRTWLSSYADENLDVAGLALEHGHLNSCLQNAQQAVEKYLKAVMVQRAIEFRRTHRKRNPLRPLVSLRLEKSSLRNDMFSLQKEDKGAYIDKMLKMAVK